jgi:glutamate/tyrosine decarboxylase-like PLP-dependent enzyme
MVVSVAGTTELGELDPIDAVADHLQARTAQDVQIWHHVDAAYGGFFCALGPEEPRLEDARRRALAAIRRADTVTVDPHKLGYAPYACGALLVRDEAHDAVSSFAAPYIDRPELSGAAWTRTIEGSRPATGAAATWLTGRTLGFGPEGMGSILSATLESCAAIRSALCAAVPQVRPLDPADTNIFCFSVAEHGEALSAANARTSAVHQRFVASPTFAMSRTVLSTAAYPQLISRHVGAYGGSQDCDRLVLLRCVAMNPFWAEPAVRGDLLPQLAAELRGYIHGRAVSPYAASVAFR